MIKGMEGGAMRRQWKTGGKEILHLMRRLMDQGNEIQSRVPAQIGFISAMRHVYKNRVLFT